MPMATCFTSAPSRSQMTAISLMNEMRVARNALEAYLIISAVRRSVMMIGAFSVRYRLATCSAARGSFDPRTTRSGNMKSPMADPSRRNSGLLTTEMETAGLYFSTMLWTRSPEPMGTVLLLMMMHRWVITSAMDCAAARTYFRSAAPPSSPVGVGTAMKMNSAELAPSSYDVVKCSLPAATFRSTISASPGSKMGRMPSRKFAIFCASVSTHHT